MSKPRTMTDRERTCTMLDLVHRTVSIDTNVCARHEAEKIRELESAWKDEPTGISCGGGTFRPMSPTHVTKCVVCEEPCYCCNDTHALGCGGLHGEGGCENPPAIEFCSLECAKELQRRVAESIENYHRETDPGSVP